MRGCSPTGASATRRLAEAGSASARRVAVAYSGGRDSTALLHVTLKVAEALDIHVVALHVHHGLSPNADAWLSHCRERCRRWARAGRPVTFAAERIAERPAPGESLEAWARRVRYAALRRLALSHGVNLVLLGQHRRDQAETFLLQALRGAGPAGLGSMPRVATREGVTWARPWLDVPRTTIDAYVRSHRLVHVEDESNGDARHARNRLRAQVWPVLLGAFPDAEVVLAKAASRAQEGAAALAELAALDLALIAPASELDIARWSALSAARRANLLRAWLHREAGRAPGALVDRLLRELPEVRSARWQLEDGELQSHRGRLRRVASVQLPGATRAVTQLSIGAPGVYQVPSWHGALRAHRVMHGGLPLARLDALELRSRTGGERFQAGAARPARSLKKQYQAAGLAPWQRDGPLVYSRGALVFVPRLGVDARARASAGELQLMLEWISELDPDTGDPSASDAAEARTMGEGVRVAR